MQVTREEILKLMKFSYLKRNRPLIQALLECDRKGSNYEQLEKKMNGEGLNTAGLKTRAEMGIRLGLIDADTQSLSCRKLYLSNECLNLYESEEFETYVGMLELAEDIKRDRKKMLESMKRLGVKTLYIV